MRVLSRFGPRLPQMAEAALIRANTPEPAERRRALPPWAAAVAGLLLGAALVALGTLLT